MQPHPDTLLAGAPLPDADPCTPPAGRSLSLLRLRLCMARVGERDGGDGSGVCSWTGAAAAAAASAAGASASSCLRRPGTSLRFMTSLSASHSVFTLQAIRKWSARYA